MSLPLLGLQFRPSRYPTAAFLLLFPLLLSLGLWQLDRAEEKEVLQATMGERSHDLPLDLNLTRELTAEERFRPARARGRYLPAQQWLQDNRIRDMHAGYHVYSLFEMAGTRRTVLVNRGWVPIGSSRQILPELPLPDGELTLVGNLDRPASVGIAMGDVDYRASGVSVLPYLDIERLGQAIARNLLPLALVLDDGQPGVLTPDPLPVAQLGSDKHLGYAVQWFGLAVALLMIYVGLNTRRAVKERSR